MLNIDNKGDLRSQKKNGGTDWEDKINILWKIKELKNKQTEINNAITEIKNTQGRIRSRLYQAKNKWISKLEER